MKNVIHKFEKYLTSSLNNLSLQNQHLSGAGATFEFEEKLKKYYSKKFVITFCNCSTALLALCNVLNLNKKEIITTPLNWGGSLSPFLMFGNKILFSSIKKLSFNLNPIKLSELLTRKTNAVLSVDYNGTPADSKAISNFCKSTIYTFQVEGPFLHSCNVTCSFSVIYCFSTANSKRWL